MMSLPEAAAFLVINHNGIGRERVIAEWDGQGWIVMWEDGRVEGFTSQAAVLRAVKARADGVDIHIAEVEWRS